jgi:hypothetical protein
MTPMYQLAKFHKVHLVGLAAGQLSHCYRRRLSVLSKRLRFISEVPTSFDRSCASCWRLIGSYHLLHWLFKRYVYCLWQITLDVVGVRFHGSLKVLCQYYCDETNGLGRATYGDDSVSTVSVFLQDPYPVLWFLIALIKHNGLKGIRPVVGEGVCIYEVNFLPILCTTFGQLDRITPGTFLWPLGESTANSELRTPPSHHRKCWPSPIPSEPLALGLHMPFKASFTLHSLSCVANVWWGKLYWWDALLSCMNACNQLLAYWQTVLPVKTHGSWTDVCKLFRWMKGAGLTEFTQLPPDAVILIHEMMMYLMPTSSGEMNCGRCMQFHSCFFEWHWSGRIKI